MEAHSRHAIHAKTPGGRAISSIYWLHHSRCRCMLRARFAGCTLSEARFELEVTMSALLARFWADDKGQDIAEYAVMLAAILVLVIGTIRLVGSNANNVFSTAASALQ